MLEFVNRFELNSYYYDLFRDLSDSRMFLSKKMLSELEKDIYNAYANSIKLFEFNKKYSIKMRIRELCLERKMMKKKFKHYKKNFVKEYNKIIPLVSVSVNSNIVMLSNNCLPKLKVISDIKGKISYDNSSLITGVNRYSWTFVPNDNNKYSVVNGEIEINVIDDINLDDNN